MILSGRVATSKLIGYMELMGGGLIFSLVLMNQQLVLALEKNPIQFFIYGINNLLLHNNESMQTINLNLETLLTSSNFKHEIFVFGKENARE